MGCKADARLTLLAVNAQMVIHRLNTGGPLCGDTDCVLLLFIADHAPEINDPVVDNHVDHFQCSCPRQLAQIRQYDFPQGFVSFRDVDQSQPTGRQRLHEIGAADDADKPTVLDYRHPLNAVLFEKISDLLQRRVGTDADHLTRHHIFGLSPRRFDKLGH